METGNFQSDISVAVFDSGIGGLNLLKECALALPSARFYYLADNYNVPYGDKGKAQIFELVKSKLDKLDAERVSAAVIACNTATSNCIEDIRAAYPFPVIGIQPAVKPAAERGGKCLVLATPSTVKSPSLNSLIGRCAQGRNAEFIVHACEGLAEYIEEHAPSPQNLPEGMLPAIAADSVVLGCTHYVFIKEEVKRRYGCEIFDGIKGTAARLCEILGIDNHFKGKRGICAHQNIKAPEITFIGGDFIKNARIFDGIWGKSD